MKLTSEQVEQIKKDYPGAYYKMLEYDFINEKTDLADELKQSYTPDCRKKWIISRLQDMALCNPDLYFSERAGACVIH